MIIFRPLQFRELPIFSEEAARLFSDSEFADLQKALMLDPEKGDLIRETGGARKLRVALRGRGRRGGGRVVYYYKVAEVIHLLLIYPKNEQEDLSPGQLKWVREVVRKIKEGKL